MIVVYDYGKKANHVHVREGTKMTYLLYLVVLAVGA